MTTHETLAAQLEAQGAELSRRTIARLYEDPFWDARFGARGRKFSDEDGQFHVTHLVEALRSTAPDVFANYAAWLRALLVPRGMCSRHLATNFEALADTIAAAIERSQPAQQILRDGAASLRHRHGPAQPLDDARDAIVDAALARLWTRQPAWRANEAGLRGDLQHHLSYLCDALALDRAELLVNHVRWTRTFLASRGAPAGQLDETLAALAAALPVDPGATTAAQLIAAALAA